MEDERTKKPDINDETGECEGDEETPPANDTLPSTEGKPTDPHHAVIALRELADEHALQLAKGERTISKGNRAFAEVFQAHAKNRIDLERRQCELLLKLEKVVPYGHRGTWKAELAQSLTRTMGRGYSVTVIEARLTLARRAADDPGLWIHMLSWFINSKASSLNVQTVLKKLKPKDEEEGAEEPARTEHPEQTAAGELPEGDDDGQPDIIETEAVPTGTIQQLRADVDRADAVLTALDLEHADDPVVEAKKLREHAARVPELERENAELRAEVARLHAALAETEAARASTAAKTKVKSKAKDESAAPAPGSEADLIQRGLRVPEPVPEDQMMSDEKAAAFVEAMITGDPTGADAVLSNGVEMDFQKDILESLTTDGSAQ